jgi:acyl carrier protein
MLRGYTVTNARSDANSTSTASKIWERVDAMPNRNSDPLDETKILHWLREKLYADLGIKREAVVSSADWKRDLALDSLDELDLALAIEEEYGIDIVFGDENSAGVTFEEARTVGEAIAFINKKLRKKEGWLF